ncbi:kinase-like domain-containing protein [Desarmillaria tabescens]|uniref:non-specific serine/threonine protein kinase n=1 Tax=Armillaria tabescens TaxID=1929756 RepID=A0AA39NFH7_ARMTA|nr:kinase-like domain-containing protein [Desarmillaria tabescens]KAK0464695.1 kinase-like domain-containing protein [Desarmillaria tabescens]
MSSSSSFLDQYEPLDVIGNGSFGIIRKVRRKTDGLIFARKELDFERMNERDRKQIVSEVNILKELHHEHIVRYHDRYVDRDAGILYILMEYCGGGDLSNIIKQAVKHNRTIPEETIWSYFMQILLALHHCHHPNANGHGRSGSTGSMEGDKERRVQILHRDLKPDNVFLDESGAVKLGDFGLSKALAQASFANTYVGTPYYMSPELMQEKAYDSKSDIWSLGCLIFELCALKPPFHEAKTHSELSILIRNGRVPPLPKGFSQSLTGVIKTMLSLNPAMRPSAAQLLQHERIELAFKVWETERIMQTVKVHKHNIILREREFHARETKLVGQLASREAALQTREAGLSTAIKHAIAAREEELRVLVKQREEEVAAAIARREEDVAAAMRRREEEIIASVNAREKAIFEAWKEREDAMEARIRWVEVREMELEEEAKRVEAVKNEVEAKMHSWEREKDKGKKGHHTRPLEEVKNLLEPLSRLHMVYPSTPAPPRPQAQMLPTPASAMRGVVLTDTGEQLATPGPMPAELFVNTPKVGLNFVRIFDFEDESDDGNEEERSPVPVTPSRKRASISTRDSALATSKATALSNPPPTRLRRPSITRSSTSSSSSTSDGTKPQPLQHPHLKPASSPSPPPTYDLADEENLPSPFLKRAERANSTGSKPKKRPSNGNLLRAVAAANSAVRSKSTNDAVARPSVASARKAGEEGA